MIRHVGVHATFFTRLEGFIHGTTLRSPTTFLAWAVLPPVIVLPVFAVCRMNAFHLFFLRGWLSACNQQSTPSMAELNNCPDDMTPPGYLGPPGDVQGHQRAPDPQPDPRAGVSACLSVTTCVLGVFACVRVLLACVLGCIYVQTTYHMCCGTLGWFSRQRFLLD